ncbi:MAG: DNA alkylation repair protein [Aeromonadales bacterium]|nr:DNA alkylation repair protein [Aeromonadales bacterium]
MNGIQSQLLADIEKHVDKDYLIFFEKINPHVKALGVRVPILRKIAKEYLKKYPLKDLLNSLPDDSCFEMLFMQCVFIGSIKDVNTALNEIKKFLPSLNGWCLCDTLCSSLKLCKKHKIEFFSFIEPMFLQKDEPYTVRFALVMSNDYFAGSEFEDKILSYINDIDTTHYYVHMAVAWCLATFYCKNPEKFTAYLENCPLNDRTFNKTIQKIKESLIPSVEQKKYLCSLKR